MDEAEAKLRKANVELGVVLGMATIALVGLLLWVADWNPISAAYLLGVLLIGFAVLIALLQGLTAVILFLMNRFKGEQHG